MTDTENTDMDDERNTETNGETDTRLDDGTPSVTPISEMDDEERQRLLHTFSNPAWWDEDRALGHPAETVSFLAIITCDGYLASCVPAIRQLEGHLEPVSMSRIRDLMLDMYSVDEQGREDCRRMAQERLRTSGERDEKRQRDGEERATVTNAVDTTDNLQGYLDRRGITDEQMEEARRRTREQLEKGTRQTDFDVAIAILADRIGEKLNELREADRAGDRELEDELLPQLNELLTVRHKVYMGNEQAVKEALEMAGGTDETEACSTK